MTIVPGFMDRKLQVEIQTARVIDVLRRAAEIYEPHGLVMVMEPLNTLVNHPGVFMSTVPQGYALTRAVDRPEITALADRSEARSGGKAGVSKCRSRWSPSH